MKRRRLWTFAWPTPAKWIAAAESAFNENPGSVIDAVRRSQDALVIERVNDEPLTIAFRQLTMREPFEGFMGDLYKRLELMSIANLPRSAASLSSAIARQRGSMEKVGIKIDFLPRTNAGKRINRTRR